MSLAALAAVSRNGSPMFLRDYVKPSELLFNFTGMLDDDDYFDDDDIFGDVIGPRGAERSSNLMKEWPCRLLYQFILHSACHRLYEILAENKWKAPGAVGMDACWVGYLCSAYNFRAYGKSISKGDVISGRMCLSRKKKSENNFASERLHIWSGIIIISSERSDARVLPFLFPCIIHASI